MIKKYNESFRNAWDDFIDNQSINGNFLQSRRFLSYHGDRFVDHSLLFYKGERIVAVLPACLSEDGRVLNSHAGATFGGLIPGAVFASITNYDEILDELLNYMKEQKIEEIVLKMPSKLYSRRDTSIDVLEYMLRNRGFAVAEEVGFYLPLIDLADDFESNFSVLRKRKYKKSLKAGLSFRRLETVADIERFYGVLLDNYVKFGTAPVHNLDEILLLYNKCIPNEIAFYGVFHGSNMVAGSMVFDFCHRKTFHTQYLASSQNSLDLCPNEFLYTSLIKEAKKIGYRYLSFGTTTLEHGKIFNHGLAIYKEGYGTQSYINRTYTYKQGGLD